MGGQSNCQALLPTFKCGNPFLFRKPFKWLYNLLYCAVIVADSGGMLTLYRQWAEIDIDTDTYIYIYIFSLTPANWMRSVLLLAPVLEMLRNLLKVTQLGRWRAEI